MTVSASEKRAAVIGALLAISLSALDQTIVATALPAMARELGDVSLLSWVLSAYLLTSTCAMPIAGKLSDVYGRRRSLIAALLIFVGASVFCALATSMPALILARAIQGLGGGSLMVLSQAVIADVVSPRERGHYSAHFSVVYASASILGPTLGGVVSQYWGWAWIFWINLPLGAVALVIVDRALRHLTASGRTRRVDYAGILSLSVATVALMFVLSWGGKKWPWASAEILTLAIAAVILFAIFARVQLRAAEPILPPRFLADRLVLRPLLSSTFVIFGTYLAITVIVPVYFQVALGTSPSLAGILTIPLLVVGSASATCAGWHSKASGRYKMPTLLGMPVAIAALAALAYVADSTTPMIAAILLAVVGLGLGPTFPAQSVATLNAVALADVGAVSGALSFTRSLGAAIAIAAYSALVLGLASSALPGLGAGGLEDLVRQALPPATRAAVAAAFGTTFAVMAAAFAVGLLVFMRTEDRVLRHGTDSAPADEKV